MELEMLEPKDADEASEYIHPIWVATYEGIVDGGRPKVERIFPDWVGPQVIREKMSHGYFFAYVIDDGERAGLLSGGVDGTELDVSKIYIDRDHRGKGLGSQCLEYLLDYGRRNGCDHAVLVVNKRNSPAISMYRRYGFTDDGYENYDPENPEARTLRMRLVLRAFLCKPGYHPA